MSEFIEARCPTCRNMKDPAKPLCGPCALNVETARKVAFTAFLEKRSMFTLSLIIAGIMLAKFAGTIGCLAMAWHYYSGGRGDLAAIWIVLAAFAPRK